MRTIVGLAVMALTACGPAAAAPGPEMLGFMDAATLSGFCSATGSDQRLVCLSYITGAADQLLSEQALGRPEDRRICLPAEVTAQAVLAAVVAYAGLSSSAKGVSGANFVRYALVRAYPCGDPDRRDM